MPRRILVTSALPYANGAIHLGHLVEYVQTDIWVRFQKMRGHECWYVCADDTHGTPIMLRAEKDGITPEALIARVHGEHSRDFAGFHVAFDNFYTTHSPETRECANTIYARLQQGGGLIGLGLGLSAPANADDSDDSDVVAPVIITGLSSSSPPRRSARSAVRRSPRRGTTSRSSSVTRRARFSAAVSASARRASSVRSINPSGFDLRFSTA